MPAGRFGQRVEVEAQLALLAAGQMRRGQLPRQPPVAFRAAGQHQQMRAGRIRLLGAGLRYGRGSQRQLGAEHGTHVEFRRRFGEPHRPVQAVVVGQREGAQIQPGRLFDQLLRCAGPVEKAVRRMRMQLGIRDGRADRPVFVRRLVQPRVCATRGTSSGGSTAGGAPAWRGLPSSTRSISAQLGGPLNQPHPDSLSNICSIIIVSC